MPADHTDLRIGVYVDVANIARNGGYGMRYEVLREFACRGGALPIRLNAYVAFDAERSKEDAPYREGQRGFHDSLREQGYKVIVKVVKWYRDEAGKSVGKANADLNLAVDALLQSENMDRVLLVTGDGDFVQVVNALQNRGCRVEVVAFDNVSSELRREADMYMPGYLIPELLPIGAERGPRWGEEGSRVRGVCYSFKPDRGFGFLRFLKQIDPGLWHVDSRRQDSPFQSVFFHKSSLQHDISERFPSRDIVLEFELNKSTRIQSAEEREDRTGFQAADIKIISGA